jgi:uncharacterized membrane protein
MAYAYAMKRILIHAPIEQVYALARNPRRWDIWYVGLSEPDKLTGTGEAGTVVEQSYLLAGILFPVTTRVLEEHIGSEGAIWKAQIEGPLAGEQIFTFRPKLGFTPKSGDTEIVAELEYTIPGKAISKLADRLIIERIMEHNLERSLEDLKMMCSKQPTAV